MLIAKHVSWGTVDLKKISESPERYYRVFVTPERAEYIPQIYFFMLFICEVT